MTLRQGSPEEVGMCPQRLERVRAALREWMVQAGQSAVAALVARRGVIVLHEALGRLRAEADAPPTQPDTIFWIASIGKPILATAAMILVEEGRLGANVPVSYYVPEFTGRGKDVITILHLMTHTSGMRDEDLDEYAAGIEKTTPPQPPEPALHPVIARYLSLRYGAPLLMPPGQEMSYCVFGYDLLGEIVRRVSGRSLGEFAAQRIFQPLGMVDTSWGLEDSRIERLALPAEPQWSSLPEWLSVPFPNGMVLSTAQDLAVFCQMFLNGGEYGGARILGPATVAEMTRNQIPGISSRYRDELFLEACWGLGWMVGQGWRGLRTGLPPASTGAFSHVGASGAYVWARPEYDLVGVYLTAQDTSRTLSRYDFDAVGRKHFGAYQFADAVTAAIVDTERRGGAG